MPSDTLESRIGVAINEWFEGGAIDVHLTLDSMLAVMASIAFKAGCNTDERVSTLTNHLKANLTVQMSRERAFSADKH